SHAAVPCTACHAGAMYGAIDSQAFPSSTTAGDSCRRTAVCVPKCLHWCLRSEHRASLSCEKPHSHNQPEGSLEPWGPRPIGQDARTPAAFTSGQFLDGCPKPSEH